MDEEAKGRAVFNILGLDYFEKSNRLAFCCPFHDDRDPSAGFYLDTGLFHCFSCGFTIPPVKFYARYQGISNEKAEAELERETGLSFGDETRKPDRASAAKRRARMELALQGARGELDRKTWAAMAEDMDMILEGEERGTRTQSALDKSEEIWYNILKECTNGSSKSLSGRTPRDRPDARLQEGVGHLPGDGRQDGYLDLE